MKISYYLHRHSKNELNAMSHQPLLVYDWEVLPILRQSHGWAARAHLMPFPFHLVDRERDHYGRVAAAALAGFFSRLIREKRVCNRLLSPERRYGGTLRGAGEWWRGGKP